MAGVFEDLFVAVQGTFLSYSFSFDGLGFAKVCYMLEGDETGDQAIQKIDTELKKHGFTLLDGKHECYHYPNKPDMNLVEGFIKKIATGKRVRMVRDRRD